MRIRSQYQEDIIGPYEIRTEEVERKCPICGYAASDYNKDRPCPHCGGILSHGPGGGYAEWVLDGGARTAQVFQGGITEQSIVDFEKLLKDNKLPDDQIKKITDTLKSALPTTAPEEPKSPESPEKPLSPSTTKTILKPGEALEMIKPPGAHRVKASRILKRPRRKI